ncbi:MAG: DNA-binding protein [Hyphomicrobiaceae bacterium]|nr:MAG: DNA-binding protein [Hyphomicrobiaceae bacterium]
MKRLEKRPPGRPRKETTPAGRSLADDPMMTARQAETLCGLSSKTLRRAICLGELKAQRFLARPGADPHRYSRYLIRRSDLEDWLKSRCA